ncbi:AsnC family transcriptional regulator [Streptomyces massasporeus]
MDLLQSDGRIKLSELGRRVRLSPAAVTERVRRLAQVSRLPGVRLAISPYVHTQLPGAAIAYRS